MSVMSRTVITLVPPRMACMDCRLQRTSLPQQVPAELLYVLRTQVKEPGIYKILYDKCSPLLTYHTLSIRLLQHPPAPVRGLLLLLFCGLHGDGTGLGETHGLRLVSAQPLVKIDFVGMASEGQRT